LIAAIAYITSPFSLIATATFFLGLFVTGAQAGINVLAASFYPTSIRSTGLGWALGVGRIGSIVGPMLAGFMLKSLGWSPHLIVLSTVIPALLAAAAVMASVVIGGPSNAYNPEVFKAEASDVAEMV
jgi:AAHS family 4-hydroxybenzoate transporter-like MFS transporter